MERTRILEWVVVACLVAGGFAMLVAHYDLPIVRNSLVYARIAYSVIDLGFAFDSATHAYNKALGFPFLSMPFVLWLGVNTGLKVSSFLWTALWIGSMVCFYRRLETSFPIGRDGAVGIVAALIVASLSPLFFYQFVSGYPDSLNALTFLWAIYFLDRATSPARRKFDIPMFVVVTIFAIWIKHAGFILLAMGALFALCRLEELKRMWGEDRKAARTGLLSLGALTVFLGIAQLGVIPGFNLSQNVGNYTKSFDVVGRRTLLNLPAILSFTLLSFGVLTPLILRWREVARFKVWYLTILLFSVSLIVYRGTRVNLRYFLPIVPLVAWIIVANWERLSIKKRRALMATFVATQLLTIGYYNSFTVYHRIKPFVELPRFDNLRLVGKQRELVDIFAALEELPSDRRETLYFVSNYYGGAKWFVWEREGLFPEGIRVTYMNGPDWDRILTDLERSDRNQTLVFCDRREWLRKGRPPELEFKKVKRTLFSLTLREEKAGDS